MLQVLERFAEDAMLPLIGLDLALMGVGVSSRIVLIVAVIIGGAFLGVNNTLITTAVMQSSPVERPVASASYSFIRFVGARPPHSSPASWPSRLPLASLSLSVRWRYSRASPFCFSDAPTSLGYSCSRENRSSSARGWMLAFEGETLQ